MLGSLCLPPPAIGERCRDRVGPRYARRWCYPAGPVGEHRAKVQEMTGIRLAIPGDKSPIQAFLSQHEDGSLDLRTFLSRGGAIDEGKPLQGTYAIAFVDDNVVGVAMHNWQNGIFLRAPNHTAALARMAFEETNRALIAPHSPVVSGRDSPHLPRMPPCSQAIKSGPLRT